MHLEPAWSQVAAMARLEKTTGVQLRVCFERCNASVIVPSWWRFSFNVIVVSVVSGQGPSTRPTMVYLEFVVWCF
jgi:hypothetical protein